MSKLKIELKNVHKAFGAKKVLNGVDLTVEEGEIVTIVGPNGCGKTTLAKALKPDWLYLDLEKTSHFNRIERDPEFFFQQNMRHVIIDEAQCLPVVFELLRGVIDERRDETDSRK